MTNARHIQVLDHLLVEFGATAEYYDAITAAIDALRLESEWQPIETAPRDGTEIWAFNPTFEEQCVIRWCAGTEWSGWLYNYAILNDCLSIELSPTHWQPLPPPPAGEKE